MRYVFMLLERVSAGVRTLSCECQGIVISDAHGSSPLIVAGLIAPVLKAMEPATNR